MTTRRSFLQTSALAGLASPLILPASVRAQSPNGKVSHAAIGCSHQAWSDLQRLASGGKINVTALCDVDTAVAEEARAAFPDARFYQDWRELLTKEEGKIDSVNVSVPDHLHASISLAALEKGLHVYCQKPLTHTIAEARALVAAAAAKPHLVTQTGNQIQSEYEYRAAVELLRGGVIGKVKEVHAWVTSTFPQRGRPEGADEIPTTLAWDQWLGPAPARPYKKDIYHRFNWRGWQDFGGGPLADFCCHILDTPYKALDLRPPVSATATVPAEWSDNDTFRKENWPDWATYRFEFAATSLTTGTLPVFWYDGGKHPDEALFQGARRPGSGALFIGEEGSLVLPHYATPRVLGKKVTLPKLEPRNHYQHYLEAILSGGTIKTTSPFSYGAALTEAGLVGLIAARFPGQTLQWDEKEAKFTNHDAANAHVNPPYREGWKVKGLA